MARPRLCSRWRSLLGAAGGVALVEFALALPLLIILFAGSVELTRMWMTKRAFENTIDSIARMAARYPEYDQRVRSYAPILANALMPGRQESGINMSLDSLLINNGVATPMFATQALVGTGTTEPWSNHIVAANYANQEAILFVSATYVYRPLFAKIIGGPYTFSKSYILMPFFSRQYPYNAGVSPDVYVDQ